MVDILEFCRVYDLGAAITYEPHTDHYIVRFCSKDGSKETGLAVDGDEVAYIPKTIMEKILYEKVIEDMGLERDRFKKHLNSISQQKHTPL